jgi:hypothetical protein
MADPLELFRHWSIAALALFWRGYPSLALVSHSKYAVMGVSLYR